MTPTTNYVCNPVMCDCPSFNHPCVDDEDRLFERGLHKGDSNFDVLPRDLIEKIGGFLLHPEYEEQIIHSATGHYPVPGAPKVPKALTGFEQQSTYVRTCLNPITVPIREAADAYKWNEFKKKSKHQIAILTLFTIGMAMEAPMALTAAKVASQLNGVQTIASIGMGLGMIVGTYFGMEKFSKILKVTKENLYVYSVIGGVAMAFGVNPVAAFVTHYTAIATGITTGSVIKLGLDKTALIIRHRVITGMLMSTFIVAAHVFWNNPFPIIENQST